MLAEAGVDVAVVDAGPVGRGATGVGGHGIPAAGDDASRPCVSPPPGEPRAGVRGCQPRRAGVARRASRRCRRSPYGVHLRAGSRHRPGARRRPRRGTGGGTPVREDAPGDLGGRTPVRALALDDQLALDPALLTDSLARRRGRRGSRAAHRRARHRRARAALRRVDTDRGPLSGDTVVLATGTPITRRGLYDLKTRALRSWAIAFELEADAERPAACGARSAPTDAASWRRRRRSGGRCCW